MYSYRIEFAERWCKKMPFKNGEGPLGDGPLTGRGFGPCKADRSKPNFQNLGRGLGKSHGRGRKQRKPMRMGYRCLGKRINPRGWFKQYN